MNSPIPSTERDLGRVEGKLDLVLLTFGRFEEKMDRRDSSQEDRLAARIKANDDRHAAHDNRFTALERKVLLLATALAGVTAAGAGAGAYSAGLKAVIASLVHGAV